MMGRKAILSIYLQNPLLTKSVIQIPKCLDYEQLLKLQKNVVKAIL